MQNWIKSYFLLIISSIIMVASIVFLLVHVASDKNKDVIAEAGEKFVVEISEDVYGNIIQKTIYDTNSEMTYLYSFSYKKQDHEFVCVDSSVVVVDRWGRIKNENAGHKK